MPTWFFYLLAAGAVAALLYAALVWNWPIP
jgi:hypothetical protein